MPQQILLMFAVMPLWLAAGAVDWALHRRARIESTAGVPESALHLLMLAQMGAAVLGVIVLEFNAGVLVLCAAAFATHEFTVYADLKWASSHRAISPLEQMVHSVQEIVPLAAIALLASLHWEEALALVGLGPRSSTVSFAPMLRRDPLPETYLWGLGVSCAIVLGCYLEELWRCLRAATTSRRRGH